jgi:hypothetical protein
MALAGGERGIGHGVEAQAIALPAFFLERFKKPLGGSTGDPKLKHTFLNARGLLFQQSRHTPPPFVIGNVIADDVKAGAGGHQ